MRRTPLIVVVVLVAAFAVIGGFLIFGRQSSGGQAVRIDVTVTGAAHMKPDHLSVRQGDTVTINISSDRAGEVHLHGYDLTFETRPGEVASHTFRADKTGHFDIEWESTSTPLGDLVVNP